MTKIIDTYNAIVGAAVALLTAVFGAYWYLFAAYLLLNILDWLSGWAKSRKLHKESSAAGLIGIVKKTGYWAIIAVAFLIASTFTHLGADLLGLDLSFLALLGWFTLACLLVNEARVALLAERVDRNISFPSFGSSVSRHPPRGGRA